MSKRTTKAAPAAHEEPAAPVAEATFYAPVVWEPETPEQEAADDAEIDADNAKSNSVVPGKYKLRYKERAKLNGHRSKAAKRSNWDWLAQTLAVLVLDKKGRIDIGKLVAVLQANGMPDPLTEWPNRSKGWEGRIRMTGGIWLRREVAEQGVMHTPDGEELVPPPEWVAKHLS